jgi:hypothetical protein
MPRKNTKTTKGSKKSLKNIQQSHGKDESKPTPTTLDQIWGDDGVSKYGTMDLETYTEKVRTFTWSDLRAHAAEEGLVPVGDRKELEVKLINKFKTHVSDFTVGGGSSDTSQTQEGMTDEVRKILEEGR